MEESSRTVLRRERWLVVDLVLLGVVVALLVQGFWPQQYATTTTFSVAAPAGTPDRVRSYVDLLGGDRVAADASALLGGAPDPGAVRASVRAEVGAGDVVQLRVVRDTPQDAVLVADAVGVAFTRLVRTLESAGRPVNRPLATVSPVSPPSAAEPTSAPRLGIVVPAGALAGLVVGLLVALARARRRTRVRTPGDLAALAAAPVLAVVGPDAATPRHPAVLVYPGPGPRPRTVARRAEAHRAMRSDLRAALGDGRDLVVVGAGHAAQTSTVAVDVAAALAADGERVLLVDADLHVGVLAERLGLPASPGLHELLTDAATSAEVTHRWDAGSLDVVPAGATRGRVAGGAPTTGVADAVVALGEGYARVVVDTVTGAGAPEAAGPAAAADGTLLVVRRGTPRAEVAATLATLTTAHATLLGAVLTGARGSDRPTPAPVPEGGDGVDADRGSGATAAVASGDGAALGAGVEGGPHARSTSRAGT